MSEETEATRAAGGETERATLVLLDRIHAALEAGLEVGLSPMETARRAVIAVPTDEQVDGSPLYVAVGEDEELVRGTLEGARRGLKPAPPPPGARCPRSGGVSAPGRRTSQTTAKPTSMGVATSARSRGESCPYLGLSTAPSPADLPAPGPCDSGAAFDQLLGLLRARRRDTTPQPTTVVKGKP